MNKVAVITGASRGIGRELAFVFAKNGFNVVVSSRNEKVLEELAEEISNKYGVKALAVKADVAVREDCMNLIDAAVSSSGRLDVLINNAGVGIYSPVEETEEEKLRHVFDVNFFGTFYCIKYALPHLKKSMGSIINISSVAGIIPTPFMGGYSASKFALNALTEVLRAEVKKHGIHVLLVCPGVIDTDFTENAYGNYRPKLKLRGAKPSALAEKIFDCYKDRKKFLVYPFYYRLMIFAYRMFPSFYGKIGVKLWKRRES